MYMYMHNQLPIPFVHHDSPCLPPFLAVQPDEALLPYLVSLSVSVAEDVESPAEAMVEVVKVFHQDLLHGKYRNEKNGSTCRTTKIK